MMLNNVRCRTVVQMNRTVKINMINVLRLICVLFGLRLLVTLLVDNAEDKVGTASVFVFASFDADMAEVTIVGAGTVVVDAL